MSSKGHPIEIFHVSLRIQDYPEIFGFDWIPGKYHSWEGWLDSEGMNNSFQKGISFSQFVSIYVNSCSMDLCMISLLCLIS